MANTVNAALKPLETLSRIVNQPSSLFGSKSASNKTKAEQDAQGATQDSNSNQQDPGRESEQMDWRADRVGIVVLWASQLFWLGIVSLGTCWPSRDLSQWRGNLPHKELLKIAALFGCPHT